MSHFSRAKVGFFCIYITYVHSINYNTIIMILRLSIKILIVQTETT